jgi:N-acetylmuramoyl-L-alanine amidase
MTFSIRNHVLHHGGAPVAQARTPNAGAAGSLRSPTLLVMHYTAGFTGASAIATLTSKARKASAHLVIDRDGAVTQLAPFNLVTWHAGASKWKGRSGCNSFSIGIELVNCGPVKVRADKKLFPEVAPSKTIDPKDCAAARHPNGEDTPFWQIYPELQMEAAIAVARAICETYGIKDIAGHYDIAPTRKRDPGPAFNMLSFKSAVFGREDGEQETVRIATKKGVVEKPREELTARDLLANRSQTIQAATVVKRAAATVLTAGGLTAGSVASDPNEALQQAQTTAQSISDTATAVSNARDSVSALSDIWHWLGTHWIVALAVFCFVVILVAACYALRGGSIVIERRVIDGRSGANVGRL